MRTQLHSAVLLCLLTMTACSNSDRGEPEYIASIQKWQQQREAYQLSEKGWLNLAGLFWLEPGENSFGSGKDNAIVFPEGKAPEFMGTFTLSDSGVSVVIADGVTVLHNDKPVHALPLRYDLMGNPTVLTYGPLAWFIIKRGDKFAVRLRDFSNEALTDFAGIETFPIDTLWRITARFEPYDPPKKITVPTILGTTIEQNCPGVVVFEWQGEEYRLEPTSEPEDEELFVIFADKTNGKETYGGGRFIEFPWPDSSGTVVIDFNKAYNPPCAFTVFATCPLPPDQNKLPFRVTAGEKRYAGGEH